ARRRPERGLLGSSDQPAAEVRQAAHALLRTRQPRAGQPDRREARHRARPRDAQDVLLRRGLLPLRGVDPRRRRLPRAVDLRQPRHGRDAERRADGAVDHDRRRGRRLGSPRHRRHALVRLLAPGQEVRATRADQRAPRRADARVRGRRSRGHHGSPRRSGPGVLPGSARPHDGDDDAHAVLQGHPPRGARRRRPGRRAGEAQQDVRLEGRRRPRDPQQGAPGPPGRGDRLGHRRRAGQDRRDRRRHHRHRRHPARGGGDRAGGRRPQRLRGRDPRRLLGQRVRESRRLLLRGDRHHRHDPAASGRTREHPRALLRRSADGGDPRDLHRRLGLRRVRRREPAVL
ncbi:MAG: Ribose-phosphate pyrophosphokinase, partial [uncultured Solirubrobacteraceae bacterium]